MPDVTIPADVAQEVAHILRDLASGATYANDYDALADLLDPRPPSLRERLRGVLAVACGYACADHNTDAVLAVVADWLAAQPLGTYGPSDTLRHQRAADVALIRGGAES